ncbi:SAM-dependent methyltransferase [Amycolatopsis thailandensis]|uniref:SAM-dependent methyltransferase n=1 Tax=Amycolatopsis thailandensis TaxID=589330 RepID=A0A229RII5_9PSEU|nr:class I SAM-dependent methyltransferase [Amycolatopsis thailandensis]OXM46470.1 SAM-dependent methyltransferase [Amycolatopsis thailandensis]
MTHGFDKEYWEEHWRESGAASPPNPYLARELGELKPGTALDAGCGEGAEAIWLASRGWRVTAADISSAVLARAARRAGSEHVTWVEADLGSWSPDTRFDLVTTHYAHPAMPQLEFYDRLADWVAPGGTLLIVGHLHSHHGHGHASPAEASVTAAAITTRLDETDWEVVTAEEGRRIHGDRQIPLEDVVVRATRRP